MLAWTAGVTLLAPTATLAGLAPPPRKPKPPKLLVLDAGHGGKDPGALGFGGLQEKNITLDLTRRIAGYLRGHEQVQLKLTREKDVFVPLKDRVSMTREWGADLFISIHADSAPNPAARGLSVYSLSNAASDDIAKSLMEQETKAEPEERTLPDYVDPEVAAILLDITTKRTRQLSQAVKEKIIGGMRGSWPALSNPIRSANFVVLRAPDVPSVLLESGFLSNRQDAILLANAGHRDRLAKALARQFARILTGKPFI